MIDYERVELPRTEFRATKVRFSPVTGKRELYYPVYWKALRLFASSIAVIIAVGLYPFFCAWLSFSSFQLIFFSFNSSRYWLLLDQSPVL